MRPVSLLLLALVPLLVGCTSPKRYCPPVTPGSGMAALERGTGLECVARDPDFRPTNLVFQGGGVKGIAYVGALRIVDDLEILPGVENVAGTSAGAITATLVALRYEPKEIEKMIFALNFTRFEDGGGLAGVFRLFRRYGFFKGDYFLDWMRGVVKQKTGSEHTTFRQLEADGGFRHLRLFTTDVTSGEIQELSVHTSPDLEVALAARMSMSIPLFFASIEHKAFAKGQENQRHVFVDGGVLFNYPITTFDDDTLNRQTLGFVLLDTRPASLRQPPPIDSLLGYSRALVEADLNVQVDELKFDRPNLVRTIVVNDLGVPTTDFQLCPSVKIALIKSGADCTCSYFKERPADAVEIEQLLQPLLAGTALPTALPTANFEQCGWVLGGRSP